MHKIKRGLLIISPLTFFLFLQIGIVPAFSSSEDYTLRTTVPTQGQKNSPNQEQDQIYGVQLMTKQERVEFRSKIRAAKTFEERELIRNENYKAMRKRADSQGVILTDQQPKNKQENNPTGKMMDQGRGMDKGEGTRYSNQDGQ